MEPKTVLLVKSREVGWAAVDAALASMPGVRVVGETLSAGRAVDLVATLRPDVILSAAMVDGTKMRPLLADLGCGSGPSPIVVLFGQQADPEGGENGNDLVVTAHLLWGELSTDTLNHVLAAVLSGEVIVASRPVVKAFVEARPHRGALPSREPPPTLTARERAVLRGLADGLTLEAVAASMGMSRRTVARVVAGVHEKLGTTSYYELGAKTAALGVLVNREQNTAT
jgi:DNA-binding NarL/FixJ family response regulator